MSAEARPTIFVVDDDARFRERLARALETRGYEATAIASGEEAVTRAKQESPELAVVDLRMPGMSGLELVQALKAVDEATKIVVLTGYGSIATALEAVRLGATHYLTKPADADEILAAFTPRAPDAQMPVGDEPPSLARVEWEHIERVLADCGGNISVAAKKLGIHRRSLQRKLGKFPVSR
jgi:two-component system response regulator RegA